MEEDKDGDRLVTLCRTAQLLCAGVLIVLLALHTATALAASEPLHHFELEAGDASVTLNEFSKQSDLQVLFDYTILRGMRTQAVNGDLEASAALTAMLKGTNLMFDFVNDRTLAVTPKKPSLLMRLWHRLSGANRNSHAREEDHLEQVLISRNGDSGTQPLLGAQLLQFNRLDIDRSGLATPQDFLRTLPQVFGGGPSYDTVLGREAASNSAYGSGINLRGLNAGATLVLLDGRRIAPSGTAGAFEDISNIPLSIIDHIDVLPDGSSARYGADAVGGVVNFVTRNNVSGMQTQVRGGGVTNGSMGERQFSQFFGNTRDSGSDLLSFEYFKRDPLRAHDRWQQTSDLTPFGGDNFDFLYGSPGTITDRAGHTWAIPNGQSGTGLSAGSFVEGTSNLYDQRLGTYVTPEEERWSIFAKDSLTLTDSFGLFTEGLFTRRKVGIFPQSSQRLTLSVPQSNPFYVNPTGVAGPVTVQTGTSAFFGLPIADNRVDTGNFSLGFSKTALGSWTASGGVSYTFEKQHQLQHGFYNQEALDAALADPNPATAFNPFGDGSNTNPQTLAAIAASSLYESMSTLKTANLTARGAAFALPGGDIEATLGTELRIQSFESSSALPGTDTFNSGRLSRHAFATFGDLHIPIVGERNELRFARRLELSIGARREDYSDVGSATLPKLGLLWSLRKDLSFRGTWTRSFKPPNMADLAQYDNYSAIIPLPDPASPTGVTSVLFRYGTNPDLAPETSRTWTFGTDFTPPIWPGASFSLTYFNIIYAGRIDLALLSPNVLSQSNVAWLVDRDFTQSQIDAVCNHSIFTGNPAACMSTPVGAIVDNRLRNISLLKTKGVDLIGKYSLESRSGRFDFGFNGTYIFRYEQANTPSSPLTNIISTPNNPINFRARGSMAWSRRGVGLATFVNFENSYRDTLSTPNRGVAPWTTIDMQLSYEPNADASSLLGHTQFSLSAQNLFDVLPPFLNNAVGVGYDQENTDLYGRLVSFEVRKRW